MGTTGNDSRLNYLDATFEDDAAKIQMALEFCGSKYTITKTNDSTPSIDILESGEVIDDQPINYDIIRFIIEPNDNPIGQGFEIAQALNHIDDTLREAFKKKNPSPDLDFGGIQPADEETQNRFEALRSEYVQRFGAK